MRSPLTSATAMLVGICAWLLTVIVAHRLDLAGIRGPAEVLLRRLTYRRPYEDATGRSPRSSSRNAGWMTVHSAVRR